MKHKWKPTSEKHKFEQPGPFESYQYVDIMKEWLFDKNQYSCGSKQCDFLFVPNHPNIRIQEFIKIYNKFAKKKIELKNYYPGITYLGREYNDSIK